MRYRELVEDTQTPSFEAVWEKIERECTEILAVYRNCNRVLWRGTTPHGGIYMGNRREDRIPKDTPLDIQTAIDEWLSMKGFMAVRSNSIYTVSRRSVAEGYGTPYMIFPKDGFKYTWFIGSGDMYHALKDYLHFSSKEEITPEMIDHLVNNVGDFMKKIQPQETNLEVAIQKGHEVLIYGDYYAIHDQYDEDVGANL